MNLTTTSDQIGQTQFAECGRIAYDVIGHGRWSRCRPICVNRGRAKAAQSTFKSKPATVARQLANVRRPVLVVTGSDDSDFADPEAEAAAIVGLLPSGSGRYEVIERYELIESAGHYPHARYLQQVTAPVIPFLAEHTNA